MPMQKMPLGTGAVAKKTYVDDIFSTYVYRGTGSAQSINNGIDLAGEGGMTWIKGRSVGASHIINDTVRGAGNRINSNSNASSSSGTAFLSAFNSNGFSIGNDNDVSYDDQTFASWSFRKTKGFFDVVTYTGNGNSSRQISHNLGTNVGMTIVKCTSNAQYWHVLHRDGNAAKTLYLNRADGETNDTYAWNSTHATSTHFTVGASLNTNGRTYVAYVFAGGESTAATARSVDFDGTGDVLTTATSSDFDFGSGDFTVEAWTYAQAINNYGVVSIWNFNDGKRSWSISGAGNDTIRAMVSPDGQWGTRTEIQGTLPQDQWNHLAFTRSGNTLYFFINGILQGTASFSGSVYNNTTDGIMVAGQGAADDINAEFAGKISNVRIVKGTAVYTSSFKPPTEPLTNITNTKLLCCNNSSTTGSTVTPGTITANGDPTASTDSPFDDPDGFVFGENEDQNVIKCGSYIGNSGTQEIDIGWEPQWVLIKRTDAGGYGWMIADSMRGIQSYGGAGSAAYLEAQGSGSEIVMGSNARLGISPKGIYFESVSSAISNYNGATYFYMAIRRPDGYVGKPAELGTGVFNMVAGTNSAPAFVSGFPVDFALYRQPAATHNWHTTARLMGSGSEHTYLRTNTDNAEVGGGFYKFDFMNGWLNSTGWDSTYQSWMWKRHAGFDVVTYTGNKVAGLQIPHSLNAVPEMMWVKNRGSSENWAVYHKGLNGGTNPEQYFINLNEDDAEYGSHNNMWNSTAPTSTHFTLGSWDEMNANNGNHIAMLFASVDGISKVGSYSGSSSTVTVTTGFQPRFVMFKRINTTGSWFVLDTTRGWGSGNDKYIPLNGNNAQADYDFGAPTSTGFTMNSGDNESNNAGNTYIYYAHA